MGVKVIQECLFHLRDKLVFGSLLSSQISILTCIFSLKKSTFVPNCKDIYLIKTPCPVQFWPHFTPSHLLILCLLPSSGSSSFCDYRLFFHLRCTLFHSCCHWSLLAFFSFSYQKELVRLPCQCEFKLRLAK